ncbi:hypothetical protein TNCV_4262931 [Trichonephila clavipes]|nr:hypothetical protein TNCV_4262931 [Trichonephila clavipes]
MQRDCALRIAGRGCLASSSPWCIKQVTKACLSELNRLERGVGTSRSERCHLHEDQAQNTLDRPVVEKEKHLRNARVQPTALSASIQGQVVPSLGSPVSS